MAKLNDDWFHAFRCCFTDEEDVIEFIFEHLDTSDFEDSYIDVAGYGEPNEMFKFTKEDKRQLLYDFMMELIEKADESKSLKWIKEQYETDFTEKELNNLEPRDEAIYNLCKNI